MDPRVIFEDGNLRATAIGRGREKLMVTLDHWIDGRDGMEPMRDARTFAKRGFTHIHISTARNDWYLNASLPDLLAVLTDVAAPYSHRAGVAFSMGSFGLFAMSRVITFHNLLFISPQMTFAPDLAPPAPRRDTRFQSDVPDQRFARALFEDLTVAARSPADCAILFDPLVWQDFLHAQFLGRFFEAPRFVETPGTGHPATRHLPFRDIVRAVSRPVLREGIILRSQALYEQRVRPS